ncbi:arsenite efflux transporter metallochaperone ArsD [Alicyclobacillus sp. ALC3]|uniref:arsenite efflux transporter metallochaperone ArsD n=1 Tax=Alicyclobacillus sp. ALC3 TaxID=2796143 RepID=UPI00237892DE|nr:arsenite efflux transporter metallochaperone ArsD [Alicyclobacillus sp. ALC3]WDL96567.1 arsenite efflux transporter metallochaperone ArsD [Alicyclobacillus sp. ALC3]
MKIDFFDPEMCCSTGVCGTSPDPELIRVGEMVEKLKADGHTVARHMLSRDSAAFTSNKHVYETMLKQGMKVLPIVTVDGEIRTMGRYPHMDELFAARES